MARETSQADRRQAIIAAAVKVFDARGYAAATVDAVAAEAGISHGSIYNYFHSKQDMFIEGFNESLASDEARMDELLAEDISGPQKLDTYVDRWFERLDYYRRIGGLILEAWATAARSEDAGKMNENLRQMYARWRQRLAAIVAGGIADGEFETCILPTRAASLIMGVLDGLTVHAIMDLGLDTDRDLKLALKGWLMSALGAGGGDTGRCA